MFNNSNNRKRTFISFNMKKSNTNRTLINDTIETKSRPFGKLQSLLASMTRSKQRNKPQKPTTTTLKFSNKGVQQRNLSVSTILHADHDALYPPSRIKPPLCARPFSQFIFPADIDEEEMTEEELLEEDDDLFVMEIATPARKITQKKISPHRQLKRHSIAIDFFSQDQRSTPSSSRSSSLKTIRNSEPDTFIDDSKKLARSVSQNNRLTVARARTVLGLDSWKSKENQAIHVWKNTISQLLVSTQEEEEYHRYNNATDKDLYHILTHPALIPEDQLERQRFVRPITAKNHGMIKFILNELIETEKSYNQLLKLIKDRYMQPMIAASQTKDSLVKATDIPILFNHLVDLVDLSDKLLNQFKSTNHVGLIFRSFESDLVVFLKYAMHYRANIKTIKRACNNVLFVKIDQESLSRKDTKRLGMSDYFIAPIQRIPRYCLLLKELQKYFDPMNTVYTDLNMALKILTGLAVAMDSVQTKKPLQTSLQTIKTL